MAKEVSNGIILGDEEKRKKILELRYVYRKNTRDIAKELMVSFKTIAATCREYEEMAIEKEKERKEKVREKQEKERVVAFYNDGNGNGRNEAVEQQQQQQQQQQQHHQQQQHQQQNRSSQTASLLSSLLPAEIEKLPDNKKAAIAYELYNQGKKLVDVTSTLYVDAREALLYYRDFWKLKRQYELYRIYPEIQPYLPSFINLFKELKKRGLTPQNVSW